MRKPLAALLAGLFLILFIVAVTVNQAVDTASDPGVVTGMLNDAELYDYVYDDIIGNLVYDMVENGIEVNTGLEAGSAPTILQFEDDEEAALAIIALIETLVPREYVKEKLEESLNGLVAYARGEVDEFTIDLEVQERVRTVPGAVRKVVSDLNLTERIIEDLLVPQLSEFSGNIAGQALGIEFPEAEIEANARLIFEPVWLEAQLFSAIDEITPFFAGDADSFNVVLQFDDRVTVIGEILKDKLVSEDTLYTLVFSQVVDPLVQQTLAQSTNVGFGISLTANEVVEVFEVIAPREWVTEQGEGVIDALIAYLVGSVDSLEYTVDLSERKVAAAAELEALALRKLETTLDGIPACTSAAQVLDASNDIAARRLPRCIAGGQTTIDLAFNTFSPIMTAQVASFVEAEVPSEVVYSQGDLEAQIGGNIETINDVRRRISEGVSFSDEDLVRAMADGDDRASLADARETLRIFANGVLITEKNITDNLDPAALQQFNDIRALVNTGMSLRWLLWVAVLIPLVAIAFIGGNGWAGRLRWAGGVATVCALITYGGIAVAWSFNAVATDYIPDYGASVSDEFKASYPRLGAQLERGEPTKRIERAMDSWQQGWRNQTVPWMIAGVLVFAVGFALPRVTGERGVRLGGGTAYKRSAPSSTSEVLSVPEDWGDDEDIDAEETAKPDTDPDPPTSGSDSTAEKSDADPDPQTNGSDLTAEKPNTESEKDSGSTS